MRGWDARVRIRAAVLAALAWALAVFCDGAARWAAAVAGGMAAALVIRAFLTDRARSEPPLAQPPIRVGGLLAGLGAEWTPEEAEELLERGRVAWPAEREWLISDAQLDRHVPDQQLPGQHPELARPHQPDERHRRLDGRALRGLRLRAVARAIPCGPPGGVKSPPGTPRIALVAPV